MYPTEMSCRMHKLNMRDGYGRGEHFGKCQVYPHHHELHDENPTGRSPSPGPDIDDSLGEASGLGIRTPNARPWRGAQSLPDVMTPFGL